MKQAIHDMTRGMDKSFWNDRWQRGEIGFHQSEVEPALIDHFKGLAPTRVFVPLCGKSLDLAWLASQAHEVVGVELSALACDAFYAEHRLTPQCSKEGIFTVYRGGGVTIYNGDFFEFTPAMLGPIGGLY